MADKQKTLGLICARGGSRGLPGKNIIDLGGKPLIAWTIEAALQSRVIDHLVLSTDSPEIASVAKAYGCEVPFQRPAELADDEASASDVVLHTLNTLPQTYGRLVLLQPTSPFRTGKTIDCGVDLMIKTGVESCVSVNEAKKSPNWMYYRGPKNEIIPVMNSDVQQRSLQRQKQPSVYELNGAFYGISVDRFRRQKVFIDEQTVSIIMSSRESVDIDTQEDLDFARFLLQTKNV